MNNPVPLVVDKAQEVSFTYQIGNVYFAPTYLQALIIVGLLFLLVLSIARLRRLYVDLSLKGSLSMVGIGFFLAFILEGFLIIGGKTALTELLGWRSAPKPIINVLDMGREKLVDVLGVSGEMPTGKAKAPPSAEEAIDMLDLLSEDDYGTVKENLCR